jgi:hypothetical protein
MSEQQRLETAGRARARRYTPLAIAASCILIAIFGLPSMLNLPQSNPGQVAEYAPVPPDQNSSNPPAGNFAGLGLGSGSTLQAGGTESTQYFNPQRIEAHSNFRCVVVNGVARQTEDPLSPPCVPFYQGDNGGSTYQGVSSGSINIVYYVACSQTNNTYSPTSKGQEGATCGEIDDLDAPPSNNDFLYTRGLKRYMAYFNSRYQTYKRHVHGWVFYGHYTVAVSGPGGCQDDCRRADATQTVSQLHPFAVITNGGINDYMDAYTAAMAQKKVVNFGGSTHHDSFYRQFPGLVWNFAPSYEEQASLYGSFLCQKAVGKTASFSGNAGDRNKIRKFGIIYYDIQGDPTYRNIKQLVLAKLASCGVDVNSIPAVSYDDTGSVSGNPATGPQKATELSQFKQKGVTTILWMGNPNGEYANQANRLRWYPEWLVFGDGAMEDFVNARYVNSNEWSHAWVVSEVTLVHRQQDQPCALALREVDPSYPNADIPWVCGFYDNLRQLFTGIQVAGPRLTPSSIDQGFHAIPAVASSDPEVPACFYRPDDYTCVKDAVGMWYDPKGQIQGWSGSGCWRNVLGGKRFLEDRWPPGNVDAQRSSKDICNGYTSNGSFNPYAQTG